MKEITMAILRYLDDKKKSHRVMCDIKKAKYIMEYFNVHNLKAGDIYITSSGTIFLNVNNELFLPSHFVNGVIHPLTPYGSYQDGQEQIKDYIAKRNPDIYLKFFDDVEMEE